MDQFLLKDDKWFAENVSLLEIANMIGTPTYVYSRKAIETQWRAFNEAFGKQPHQVNFAVKANSNIAVLNILARLGSGFDIVSGGELKRALKAGGDPKKIIFSGVGKTVTELTEAINLEIGLINIESESELIRINQIAHNLGKKVSIGFRVNPDVDPNSHPYISTGLQENKFGIGFEEALDLYDKASKLPAIEIQGLAFHIGSQITTLTPILESLEKVLSLLEKLRSKGIVINHLDVGGGLGVCYQDEKPPTPQEYVSALIKVIAKNNLTHLTIHVEPGRSITANAGILLTRVEYIKKQSGKDKYFAIVDAGMNDLLRPALYQAWQDIHCIFKPSHNNVNITPRLYDVVGPICESSDFLGKNRMLVLTEGSLLMILSSGAYGFSMSSNYNTRARAAEVMVDNDEFQVIRQREQIEALFADESILPR